MRHHIPEPDAPPRSPLLPPSPGPSPHLPRRASRVFGPEGDEPIDVEVRCPANFEALTGDDDPPGALRSPDDARTGGRDRPARALRPATTLVAEVMTLDPLCLHARMSARLAANLLVERRIGGAPVVDDAGVLVGVLSKTDLVREHVFADRGEDPVEATASSLGPGFHVDPEDETSVQEIMTPASGGVGERATLAQALALMSARHVDRLVVLDDARRMAGMLTASDVVRWAAGRRRAAGPAAEEPRRRGETWGPAAEPPIRGAVPR